MKTALALLLIAGPAAATPPVVPAPAPLKFSPPKGERFTLSNGMTVFLLEDHDLPIVHGTALVKTGSFYDEPGKIGVAALAGAVMRSGGSKFYDADAMNETLEFLGASVETGMGAENASASFTTLTRNRDTVLPIFADVLMNPAFREDKFRVEKDQLLESLRRRNDDPGGIARREAKRALFGPEHPYGRRYEPDAIAAISRGDLVAFHRRFFKPRSVLLALAGDFKSAEMLLALENAFSAWKDTAPEPLPAIPAAPADRRRVILIAKDNITQTSFRMVQTTMKRHDPDHFNMELMNDILGGNTFISRLFTDVRSRQGLAYGVGSFFAEWKEGGMFGAACGTRNENASKALKAVLGHVDLMRDTPVSDDELETARNSIINAFVFRFQTSDQIISQRAELEFFGYPKDYLDTYVDKLRAADKASIQAAARRWLDTAKGTLLVVGPGTLKADLEAYGPVDVRKPD